MKTYAVIVAGGSGERMGTAVPKQFLLLDGKPLLHYSITAFSEAFPGINVILVLPAAHMTRGHELVEKEGYPASISFVAGGTTRFESVKNGLKLVERSSVVFVHDGVRSLVSTSLIRRCYDAAVIYGNAIPAVAATDSVRIAGEDGNHAADRSKVFLIQTPQTFLSDVLLDAFTLEYQPGFTDEATVAEQNGVRINLVEGESSNIKITRPIDMIIAEGILHLSKTR
jgi:2-C-methyl-D-erythritol 4-phosphate cytidylyltransferase